MNPFETARELLELTPIPSSIQQIIFNMLIGYGTPSSKVLKTKEPDEDIPIRVVAIGPLNRCRHTMYYTWKTKTHCYDNASHYSREALYELHTVYLLNKKRQTSYVLSKLLDMAIYMEAQTETRLSQFAAEERKIKK